MSYYLEGTPSYPREPLLNDKVKAILTVVVAFGWLVNLLAPLFVHTYNTSLTANAPLLLILGSLFQSSRSKKNKTPPVATKPTAYREDYLP